MKKNTRLIALSALAIILVMGTFAVLSSEDLQGAVRSRVRNARGPVVTTPTPVVATPAVTPSAAPSANNNAPASSGANAMPSCQSDELQTITIQADGSTPYNERYLEKAMNEYFDNEYFDSTAEHGYAGALKIALGKTLPDVEQITNVRIEPDHYNYAENGERGTLVVGYETHDFGGGANIYQKTTVTARDEGLTFNADIELTDGTKLDVRSGLSNIEVKYESLNYLKGNGYTFGTDSIPGGGSVPQGHAYGKNLKEFMPSMDALKFKAQFNHSSAEVKRIMPNGTRVNDPVLQTFARNVLRDHPIDLNSNALDAMSSYFTNPNNGDINKPQDSKGFMYRMASFGNWYTAKQSIADGIPVNYKPVMNFFQGGKVKLHTCQNESDFDSSSLDMLYVRDGVTHNQ